MLVELNVSRQSDGVCSQLELAAASLGLDTLVFTETVEDAATLPTQSKKKTPLKNPMKNEEVMERMEEPSPATQVPHIVKRLSRLHVELETVGNLAPFHQYLKSNRKQWNLVSVKITSENVWTRLLTSALSSSVDIIQLEWYETTPPYRPNRSQLGMLATQDIYLEICLNKLLLTPSGVGANFFRNVGLICRHMPRSHIIVTTGASNPLYLRAPPDLYALVTMMFGAEPARRIVYENPKKVLERAQARMAHGVCGFIVETPK